MSGYTVQCPKCHKWFKKRSGLEWHLFHMERWRDTREILKASRATPNIVEEAEEAVRSQLALTAFAQGSGVPVEELLHLIELKRGASGEGGERLKKEP